MSLQPAISTPDQRLTTPLANYTAGDWSTGCHTFSTMTFHDFSRTKKWKSMTYWHSIFFQINHI